MIGRILAGRERWPSVSRCAWLGVTPGEKSASECPLVPWGDNGRSGSRRGFPRGRNSHRKGGIQALEPRPQLELDEEGPRLLGPGSRFGLAGQELHGVHGDDGRLQALAEARLDGVGVAERRECVRYPTR